MFWQRSKISWSPVETDYLKDHRSDDQNQLCIALGKTRNAIKNKLRELDGKAPKTKIRKTISKIGKRVDLDNKFFRSSWEANIARYFKSKYLAYEYEPKVFVFDKVKHGTVSYVPDFKVDSLGPSPYEWVEIKGMLKNSDKTRIRRFKQYYPEEFKRLRAVVGAPNTAADKFFKSLNIPVTYYRDYDKDNKNKVVGWE